MLTLQDEQTRYAAALHGVQSALAFMLQYPDPAKKTLFETKHMRVGIDSAHISHLAVFKILLDKGICTELEYTTAIADAAEEELMSWEAEVSKLLGKPVSFR